MVVLTPSLNMHFWKKSFKQKLFLPYGQKSCDLFKKSVRVIEHPYMKIRIACVSIQFSIGTVITTVVTTVVTTIA